MMECSDWHPDSGVLRWDMRVWRHDVCSSAVACHARAFVLSVMWAGCSKCVGCNFHSLARIRWLGCHGLSCRDKAPKQGPSAASKGAAAAPAVIAITSDSEVEASPKRGGSQAATKGARSKSQQLQAGTSHCPSSCGPPPGSI